MAKYTQVGTYIRANSARTSNFQKSSLTSATTLALIARLGWSNISTLRGNQDGPRTVVRTNLTAPMLAALSDWDRLPPNFSTVG